MKPEKTKATGTIEAVTLNKGREAVRIRGQWINAAERVVPYLPKFKAGNVVYYELEAGKLVFIAPDKPQNAAKLPATPPTLPPEPLSALSARDKASLAQTATNGGIALAVALIAAKTSTTTEQEAQEMASRLAKGIQKDLEARL